jgi:hypothetical protein
MLCWLPRWLAGIFAGVAGSVIEMARDCGNNPPLLTRPGELSKSVKVTLYQKEKIVKK